MIKDIKDLKEGSILSECSHYIIQSCDSEKAIVRHFESGETTMISLGYLQRFTDSADFYSKVVKVTKENRRDGALGIRSIFECIHSNKVFTVCFKKQDKVKSKKQYNDEVAKVIEDFSTKIEKVKNSKKGVAEASKSLILELMSNPVLPFIEGEDRVLRGYKTQFESRDGKYQCVDMDIEKTDKENGIRSVNINTIKWLIYEGIKYVVEE